MTPELELGDPPSSDPVVVRPSLNPVKPLNSLHPSATDESLAVLEDDGDIDREGAAPRRAPFPWRVVGADEVRLLRDGSDAFPAMLGAIASAEREILLEMYWIGSDVVGRRFRDALAERAARGVRVRVIYDALGSIGINEAWWATLLAAGGQVFAYHGLLQVAARGGLARFAVRDHRKVLVVDATTAFTGGVNLSVPWLSEEEGGASWRDDAMAVRGPAAHELRTLFYRTWARVAGEWPSDVRPIARLRGPRRNRTQAGDNAVPCKRVWALASHWRTRRSVHREYVVRIREARERVDIANSYFVPDRHVARALLNARSRGVRVRILVPERSDVAIVQYAVEASFEAFMRRGIEVYALPGRMLHAKTAVVDGEFTTIGSYNLDHRSWRKNLELNLAVEDAAFAQDVTTSFEEDLLAAKRIDAGEWQKRPRYRRAAEWVARRFRGLW